MDVWPTTSVAELLSNGKNIKKDADKLHLLWGKISIPIRIQKNQRDVL